MSNESSEGDEELMSDFQDLFEEEEPESAAQQSTSADESLDELDAFLDDFEKNLDIPDASEQSESAEPEAEPERGDVLELDKEALDLDVGLDGEVFAEEPVLDEEEEELQAENVESASDDDLVDLDAMMDEAEQAAEPEAEFEPEPEADAAGGQEELVLETPAPESIVAAAATAATAAAAAAAPATPAITPPPAPAISKAQMIIVATVLGARLLLSARAP